MHTRNDSRRGLAAGHHARVVEPQRLTRSALQQLEAQSFRHDAKRFAESVIREEATQLFHGVRGECGPGIQWNGEPKRPEAELQTVPHGSEIDLDQLCRLYRGPPASSMTPMQRYLMPDAVNDPMPMYARQAMEAAGVGYASLESLQARLKVVDSASMGREPVSESTISLRMSRSPRSSPALT
ncbi:hypothetical protein LTR53_009719 [Teratosphaeriaceae sp. CCFEE 6253]|nr:hypothetical protein LTR53_009719 [Teratosphaeriaceae sp. CCFEE 6253]